MISSLSQSTNTNMNTLLTCNSSRCTNYICHITDKAQTVETIESIFARNEHRLKCLNTKIYLPMFRILCGEKRASDAVYILY